MPEEFSDDNLGGRGAHYMVVVGRMKEGVGLQRANEDLQQVASRLAEAYPDTNTGWTVSVHSLHEDRVGDSRGSLMVLTGAVALLLLIACANIANLLLARATQRQREVALRVALGAGRGRVFGQVLSESVVLGLIGGGLGVVVAVGLMRAVGTWAPDSLPRLDQIGVDLRVLGFTILLSVGTGLLFGLVPALQSARANVNDALKERAGSGGRGAGGVRNSLVVAEVALALVVVIGAGLLMRTLWQLQAIDPGFELDGRVTARVSLPRSYEEPADHLRFFDELLTNVKGLPGVAAVGATSTLPMGGDFIISFDIESRPVPPSEQASAELRLVSPGLFEALGIPLLRGRVFSDQDRLDTQHVVVVNQRFAELYFPESDPLGERLDIGYRTATEMLHGCVRSSVSSATPVCSASAASRFRCITSATGKRRTRR